MFMAKLWYASSMLAALVSPVPAQRARTLERRDKEHYANNTALAAHALQGFWYNQTTGLWDNAWWNSGNALTTLADWAQLRPNDAEQLNISGVIHNTWSQAQQGFRDFLNDFYDDEGWWALGLIHAYDYTRRQEYLDSAVRIFSDMQGGGNTNCNGGIYWSKERKYVNAIANELYLSVAASLANRIPNDKAKYTGIAQSQWSWFANSSMINSDDLINDGLDGQCKNNGQKTWTYNQGVVLGGLVELYKATGDADYLNRANNLASASMKKLVNSDGILIEGCENSDGRCGADGAQFKGVHARNLRYLNDVSPSTDIENFLMRNADSIWDKDRDGENRLGVAWAGPLYSPRGNAQSSAMDALVGAVAVA